MSRYTGYNQRGFANSTVTVTRAASGTSTPISHANTSSILNEIYGAFDTTTTVLNATSTYVGGNTAINTTTKKFGSGSLSVGGGNANYLRIEDVLTSSGDYTVEFFFKTNNITTTNQCVMDINQSNSSHGGNSPWAYIQMWLSHASGSAGQLRVWQSTGGTSWQSSGVLVGTISADTWHHVAIMRSGNTTYYFVDGVQGGSTNVGSGIYTGSGYTYLGRRGRATYFLHGDNTFIDDFLVTPGTAKYATGGFTPPTVAAGGNVHPVSLYLPFDSDIQDDSEHSHTVTAPADHEISSTQAKFGGNSLALDGSSDYLIIPDEKSFEFGNGDFTLEFWFWTSSNGIQVPICKRNNNWGSGVWSLFFNRQATGEIEFWNWDYKSNGPMINVIPDSNGFGDSQWHHFALSRSADSFLCFLDGKLAQTVTSSHTFGDGDWPINIGRDYYTGGRYYFGGGSTGYIDDLRISKGVARYTKNFVPPSQAVGATLNGTNETNTTTDFTALYLPFDSDVNDDSSNSFSVTASGGAAVSSAQAKFGGNSLALDGTNDYLTIASGSEFQDFDSKPFTIEGWFYCTEDSTSDYQILMSTGTGGSNWRIILQPSTKLFEFYDGSTYQTTNAWTVNTWHHFAICGDGTNVRQFIDGSQIRSDSNSNVTADNTNITIGVHPGGSTYYFTGYLDDIRILKGYAKYTADFVPPTTAATTSVSETVNDLSVLYLPFDGTPETVSYTPSLYVPYDSDINDDSSYGHTGTAGGNPTIHSLQSKFGGYSLELDGNDYVSYGNHPSFDIEDEDFTIEGWAYRTSNVTYGTIAAKWDSSGNQRSWILRFNVNGHLYFYRSADGNSFQGASGNDLPALALNTWGHFAFVKKGRYGYFYINGQRSTTTMDMYNSGTSEFYSSSAPLSIGAINVGSSPTNHFTGYFDDIKITKGYAKYGLTNFTPPSSALGSAAETDDVLRGGFEDLARNHPVTKYGDATLNTSVKKFGTSSIYLDGTGDYLTVASGSELQDFNRNPFTIEGWFYCTNDTSNQHNVIMSTGTGTNSWNITITPYQKRFQLYSGGTAYTTNNTGWTVNTWHHFAVCFDGSTLRQFIDGSQIRSDSYTNLTTTFSNIDIGRLGGDDSLYFNGYLDDLRIVKGHAIYTEAFTPPSSAHGHVSIEDTTTTSESYSDSKFLSGVWDMTDVRDKMMQSTWVSNDSRLPNGAGLQDSNHRWYTAPPAAPVTIESWGAGGARGQPPGWGQYNPGGGGGYAKATFVLDAGTSLNVVVGDGGGRDGTTDFNNHQVGPAGGGGANPGNDDTGGGAGGGYSGVFEGPVSQENALIIAGGGGGGSSYPSSYGGAGGGTTGNAGVPPGAGSSPYRPIHGQGGTQSAGGAGGGGVTPGQQGSALLGGTRGPNGPRAGAGGGGGYFGGGSGGMSPHAGAGGGGSGYIHPSGTETTLTTGGNGSSSGGTTGGPAISWPGPRGGGNYGSTSSGGPSYPGRGNPGYVRITDPAGTHTFTAPGTHTVS